MNIGIPTTFNHRRYRSRLEARWAAFFQADAWLMDVEYEPFDCSGWIPDFLLEYPSAPCLVEVKPIHRFDEETATKISDAADKFGWNGAVMLLGCNMPAHRCRDHEVRIGWLRGEPDWATIPEDCGCNFTLLDGWHCLYSSAALLRLWAEAGNATQWKAR